LTTLLSFAGLTTSPVRAATSISSISDNRSSYTGSQIPRYNKFEITFQVQGTVAQNFHFPYDPSPPNGVDPANPNYKGISVDGLFLPPNETDWNKAYRQPAFYFKGYDEATKVSWDGTNHQWKYPTGNNSWKIRFSPNTTGTWKYKINVTDSSGTSQSAENSFSVTTSANHGFIRVSPTDPRYFQFDDGTLFFPQGFEGSTDDSDISLYGRNGINLIRSWQSSIFGTAWLEWLGMRNIYDGYLPRPGTEAYKDPANNRDQLTLALSANNNGWYDACRFQFWNDPEAVKQNTRYRLQIKYAAEDITGPANSSYPNFGVVGKTGVTANNWVDNCHQAGTGITITNYGRSTNGFATLEGSWNSGSNNFLPRFYVALENATVGKAWIDSISFREDLGNGQFGPEIIKEPSMQYDTYFKEDPARNLDKTVESAEKNGVYLKLVLEDKGDMIYWKIDDDGTYVINGKPDNQDGIYAQGRTLNKSKWLQQAYWRYFQARWGYSPAIHSWEFTNEGDLTYNHYMITDELGKYMRCRVFGVEPGGGDSAKCNYNHPNWHMSTTSFYAYYPVAELWANPRTPNVDYADIHAYISTGWRRNSLYESDSALFHLDYSRETRNSMDTTAGNNNLAPRPNLRGETGIDYLTHQDEQTDLSRDTKGVWLHNLIWSTLDPGAMGEIYWWMMTIESSPGPDGQRGLWEIYKNVSDFMIGIPLNNGKYSAAQAILSNSTLSVTGQKDTTNNRAHLWVWNKNYTWKNVINNSGNFSGLSGTVKLTGFTPSTTLPVVWTKFKQDGIPDIVTTQTTADSSGNLTMDLPTNTGLTDVAVKIGNYSLSLSPTQTPLSPTSPAGKPGDANGDNKVDGIDYAIWLVHFGQLTNYGYRDGDFNGSGKVDGLDYAIWLVNFNT